MFASGMALELAHEAVLLIYLKIQDIRWCLGKWACVGSLRISTASMIRQIHHKLKTETFIAFLYAWKWYWARIGSWSRFIVFLKMQDIGCCLAKWACVGGLRTSTASCFLSDPSSAQDWDIHSFSICLQLVWGFYWLMIQVYCFFENARYWMVPCQMGLRWGFEDLNCIFFFVRSIISSSLRHSLVFLCLQVVWG